MKTRYWVQVNNEMNPVPVMLTREQAEGVAEVLKSIVKENPDYLCGISSSEDNEELYDNYDEWIKRNK